MALAKNKFLPEMSKDVRDIYDRLPSEEDFFTQERERQQYYSLGEVKKALEKNRGREETVYRTMADSLTRDKDAMRVLLREDPRVWQYIHPQLRADMEMKKACLSSYDNHMTTRVINGQTHPMYSSQLPADIINDRELMIDAYRQAYQGQIQGYLQVQNKQIPLDTMNRDGQTLSDVLMAREMVLRAKSGPAMQQELTQVEREVIRNNKDDVARVAASDSRIMEAVEARAPETKKEIEMKRQEFEMAYYRGTAMDMSYSQGQAQDAAHTEYGVGVTAASQSSAIEGIARAENFTQDGIEEVIQNREDVPRDSHGNIINSYEEENQQLEETDIDHNNDGIPDGMEPNEGNYPGRSVNPAFISLDDGHYNDGPTYNTPGMPNF